MVDLRCGDCLELMKDIPDKSIDLIVTDPHIIFQDLTILKHQGVQVEQEWTLENGIKGSI